MRSRALFLAVLLLEGIALLLLSLRHSHDAATIRAYGTPLIGGDFTLIDTQGRTVTDADFRGRVMLVYMGYTRCPDVCPMTLAIISDALKTLGPETERVAPVFITLDPASDTPQVLGSYLKQFDRHIIGLTGNERQIARVTQAYKAYAAAVQTGGGNYRVEHSGYIYLMDKQGRYVSHFGPDVQPTALAAALRAQF